MITEKNYNAILKTLASLPIGGKGQVKAMQERANALQAYLDARTTPISEEEWNSAAASAYLTSQNLFGDALRWEKGFPLPSQANAAGQAAGTQAGSVTQVYKRTPEQIELEKIQAQFAEYAHKVMHTLLETKEKVKNKETLDWLIAQLVDSTLLESYQKNKTLLDWAKTYAVSEPEIFQNRNGVILFELDQTKSKDFGTWIITNNGVATIVQWDGEKATPAKTWASFDPEKLSAAVCKQEIPSENIFEPAKTVLKVLLSIPAGFDLT